MSSGAQDNIELGYLKCANGLMNVVLGGEWVLLNVFEMVYVEDR